MRTSILILPLVLGALVYSVLTAEVPAGTRATVNVESMAVYAETSTSSAVVKKLRKGDALVIDYSVVTGEGEWCGISGSSRGYVMCHDLLREEPPKQDTASGPLPAVLTQRASPVNPHVKGPIPQHAAEQAVFTAEQSALIGASKAGSAAGIQMALSKGAVLNGADKDGKTALLWAAYMGRNEAIAELLSAGADVNVSDNMGWTALEAAVWARHPASLDLLLAKGADVNARDSEGRTPLMHAAQYGDLVMMKQLLEKGSDANARNRFDQTPLMFAVALNDKAAAEALIAAGADVNAKDAAGRSVLINAVLAGAEHSANVQLLLEYNADLNARDNENRTALGWALKKGYADIVRLLKRAGTAEW